MNRHNFLEATHVIELRKSASMAGKLAERIPLISSEAFPNQYFQHASGDKTPELSLYFEIQNRCIVKNQISPHRLNFYMVFLVTSGEGIQALGASEYYIRKNMLCFVGPNVINSWKAETDDHQGYFISFSDDFFNDGLINKLCLSELPFFQVDGNAVVYLSDEQMKDYIALFKMMQDEYRSGNRFTNEILRGYLHALINKSRSQITGEEFGHHHKNSSGLRLVKAFTALYMKDVNTVRIGKEINLKKITHYATELGVSSSHLNDTIKSITGQSAGQLMRSQLVKQATMCLKHSSKSISEIAYLMGFEDPSYFSRFYKKQTGKMPSDFR